jgi:C-terminal processing protease CtpA/Prc
VFSLDGELAGVVVRCQEETHIASIRSAKELLAAVSAPVERLRREHGIQTSATEQGLRITELTIGGKADRMGLQAGDVIQVTSVEQLQGILADLGASLSVMRNGRKLSVPVEAKEEPGLGIAVRSEPSTVLTIAPDTPAFRAGLRTGDRLVRPTPAQMRRAELPLMVVYERGTKQYATVIDK